MSKKIEKLVHYICQCAEEDEHKFGATKLNKILWFSDLFCYVETGESITGGKYIKNNHGPVPQKIEKALQNLQQENKISIKEQLFYGYSQKKFELIAQADKKFLDSFQKEIVDKVTNQVLHNFTASSISELTHDQIWGMANYGEEIPLYTIFSHIPGTITSSDIAWAREACKEHASC